MAHVIAGDSQHYKDMIYDRGWIFAATGGRMRLVRAVTLGMSLLAPPAIDQTPARPVDESVWVFPEDYPSEAVVQAQEGPTKVIASISATGAIIDCRVGVTSGSRVLDRWACQAFRNRGPLKPALDASGKAIASTYIAEIQWGIWREDHDPDRRFAVQNLTLDADAGGASLDCGIGKDNNGIRLPVRSCDMLAQILPRARAVSKIAGPVTITASKVVAPIVDGKYDDRPLLGEYVLSEVKATYDIAGDGRIDHCRVVTSGPLADASLRPADPCATRPGSAAPAPGDPVREVAVWRVSIAPPLRIPLRTYENGVTLLAQPGGTAPTCTGHVGQEEERLENLCGYLQQVVDAVRVRTGHTGPVEAHLRSSSRHAPQGLAPAPVPDGETPYSRSVRQFRIDRSGEVEDCTDSYVGPAAPTARVRPCDTTPHYDRTAPKDAGGALWGMEEMQYTYRMVKDDVTNR